MNYTALYRQFRPQNFQTLVGQEHISATLLNSIRSGKSAHAYLFSGPRGTGKTSTAKIFAKALNCLEPDNGEPCNKCSNCKKITDGNSLDVIEIDAASNRGIDEIRDLREKVKYAPAEGKYKVYIIDEVHMLTTEAFNALLKTLEEPPKHIIFVLATTEPHKLPATIISRCQRFDFKRIAFQALLMQLKKVAHEAKISIDDKALLVIARKAEGGMRDALSLLDQSAAYGNGSVTYEMVVEILGAVQETEILKMLSAIIDKNAFEILKSIEYFVSQGKDLKIILYDLQEAVRNTILVKLSQVKPEILNDETYQEMRFLAEKVNNKELYHILDMLAETENTLKYAAQARITLEVGLLRTISSGYKQETEQNVSITKAQKQHKEVKQQETSIPKANTQQKSAEVQISDLKDLNNIWQRLLEETKKSKRLLHAFLIEAKPVAISDNIFKIEFDQDKEFHYQQITLPEHIKLITQYLQKLLGEKAKPEFALAVAGKREDLSEKVINLFGKDKVEFID